MRLSQQNITPTATKQANFGADILETSAAQTNATLAPGSSLLLTTLTKVNPSDTVFTVPEISLFQDSITPLNQIPNGSNINPSDYQIIGPWNDLSQSDGKNVAFNLYIGNLSSGTTTDSQTIISNTVDANNNTSVFPGQNLQKNLVQTTNGTLFFAYNAPVFDRFGNYISMTMVYITSSDNGATWSVPTTIYTYPNTNSSSSSDLSLFIDGSDNIYIIFEGNPTNFELDFVKLSYSGGSWTLGNVTSIISGGTNNRGTYGTIVKRANNNLYVVYNYYDGTNNTVQVKSSTDDGITWSTATNISSSNTGSKYPSMVLRTDLPHIVWADFGGINGFYFSEFNGSSWSAATAIFTTYVNTDYWNISGDGSSVYLVSVNTAAANPQPLNFNYYNGSAWSGNTNIGDGSNFGINSPRIVNDGTKQYAYWISQASGFTYGALYQNIRSGGTWGGATSLVGTFATGYSGGSGVLLTPNTYVSTSLQYTGYVNFISSSNKPGEIWRNITGINKNIIILAQGRGIVANPNLVT